MKFEHQLRPILYYCRNLLASILPRVDPYKVAVRVIMSHHFFCFSTINTQQLNRIPIGWNKSKPIYRVGQKLLYLVHIFAKYWPIFTIFHE